MIIMTLIILIKYLNMYNLDYNILFIHIPKTGGSSISEYFYFLDGGDNIMYKNAPDNFWGIHKLAPKISHLRLNEYKKIISHESFEKIIKFSIVRNPINRLKSLLFYDNKININNVISIDKMLPILYNDIQLIKNRGFSIDFNNNNGDATFHTYNIMRQSDFFDEKSEVKILKFENLNNDFTDFIEKNNLPKFNLPNKNISGSNIINDLDFFKILTKYHSKKMILEVLEYYEIDFLRFDYKIP